MYSSTTYNHGLGYSRTFTNHVAAPVTTTTHVGGLGDAVTTTHHGGLYGGSTVTRTFSPGRSYLHHSGLHHTGLHHTGLYGGLYGSAIHHDGLYGSTIVGAPHLAASVVHDPLVGAYGHTVLSPSRTTTSYGPFGATTRTVNYF